MTYKDPSSSKVSLVSARGTAQSHDLMQKHFTFPFVETNVMPEMTHNHFIFKECYNTFSMY